jgi:hypothetical protein
MIRCSPWKPVVQGDQGSLATTHCEQDGRRWTAQVICYPGGGRCFGYLWTPSEIDGPIHGPTFRRTAIKLLSMLRRKRG